MHKKALYILCKTDKIAWVNEKIIDDSAIEVYYSINETIRNKRERRMGSMRRRAVSALLAGVMSFTLAAAGLTGCGDSAKEGTEKVRLMVWSPQNDQSRDNGEWLQTMCEQFADEHPEWDITFV